MWNWDAATTPGVETVIKLASVFGFIKKLEKANPEKFVDAELVGRAKKVGFAGDRRRQVSVSDQRSNGTRNKTHS